VPTILDTVPRRTRVVQATLVIALVAFASACSTPTPRPPDGVAATPRADDFPRSRQVALDFVDTMARIPELKPSLTTLYTARPRSRFGEILVVSLQNAGYDLRLGAEGDAETLAYDVQANEVAASDDAEYTFRVRAGTVRMQRSYGVDDAGIRPATAMRLHGTEASALAPRPARVAPEAPRALTGSLSAASPEATSTVSLTKLPAPVPDLRRKTNMYETRRSNYADLLATYDTVSRDVMVFANDSLHLGRDNKRLARTLAARFDADTDVISVIGCSHGRTALANGNETLANGRSYRVKEALMLAGVDADLVLEEGCWAGKHFEMMPARGVVVTHKRRAQG